MFKWLYKPKLSELLEMYLETHKLASNTVRLTRQAWGQMVEQTDDIRVSRFTTDRAGILQKYWLDNTSSTTARIYRKTVSPLFSWSVQKGHIKANPFKSIRVPKESRRQVRTYSPTEFKALLWACGGNIRWLTILMLARTTGMRKSAIENLARSDINFERELIVVSKKPEGGRTWRWDIKDREEREVPLIPVVANLLTELLYAIPAEQPYVLPRPSRYFHLLELKNLGLMTDDMRLWPISNFDRKFRKIKKTAGVKGRFHDLRATCLTDLAGVLNPNELMKIGGHSDIATSMRYIGTGRDIVIKARSRVIESLQDSLTPSHAL